MKKQAFLSRLFVKSEVKRKTKVASQQVKSTAIALLKRRLEYAHANTIYVSVKRSSDLEQYVGFYVINGKVENVAQLVSQALGLKQFFDNGENLVCLPKSMDATETVEQLNKLVYPNEENIIDVSNFNPKLSRIYTNGLPL